MPFAEVIFNLPIQHAYTYRIPEEVDHLQPGMRVFAPFGRQIITGVVSAIVEETKLTSLKPIQDILDDKPLISPEMMELTRWISEYYFCGWGQAVQLALPRGIDSQQKEIIHLLSDDPRPDLTEKQYELYTLIGANPDNTKDYYRTKFGHQNFHYFLRRLEEKGLISREAERRDARVTKLIRKFVEIPADYDTRKKDHPDYLKYLEKRPEVDAYMQKNTGRDQLMSGFLKETGMASGTLHKMAGYGLCVIKEKRVERRPVFGFEEPEHTIVLNEEQRNAVSAILEHLRQGAFNAFLLHGVTGSGKTQVYIEVLRHIRKLEKSAIILIPEIALTPQTVGRFKSIFTEDIAVFHSKMSPGERFDAWMSCYRGDVRIVVGPRSALFAPLKDIGLIVVDEEHETTYKQTEGAPLYNARDTAIYWARMNNALVVLGSATPSLESYYNARTGKYQLLELLNRVDNVRLPAVFIIDMRKKRVRIDNKVSLFSQELLDKIENRLERKEQIIILQNRRGYSSFTQCKECGFIPVCPQCDLGLTYHSYNEQLKCHLCGHSQQAYYDCPSCGDKQIVYKGVGTQRIQNELQELLPEARILRMDQDTTRGKNRHDIILRAFGEHEADILLGTQMIAKGLDFENVTLVGVISADVGLAVPDFRAPERVFQLLTQVAGRSGRGRKSGEVVVQTYSYSHYAVQFASQHDFSGFYMQEMQHRRDFNYPPYVKMIQITVQALQLSDAIKTSRQVAINLKRRCARYAQVIGPAPALVARMKNLYRWQVNIKLNTRNDPGGRHTKEILGQILQPFQAKKKSDLRILVDVDPLIIS